MFSTLTWFWIIYVSIGLLMMMEPVALMWDHPEYRNLSWFTKSIASFISVMVWPLVFFVD